MTTTITGMLSRYKRRAVDAAAGTPFPAEQVHTRYLCLSQTYHNATSRLQIDIIPQLVLPWSLRNLRANLATLFRFPFSSMKTDNTQGAEKNRCAI
jgi:hypothetical protein